MLSGRLQHRRRPRPGRPKGLWQGLASTTHRPLPDRTLSVRRSTLLRLTSVRGSLGSGPSGDQSRPHSVAPCARVNLSEPLPSLYLMHCTRPRRMGALACAPGATSVALDNRQRRTYTMLVTRPAKAALQPRRDRQPALLCINSNSRLWRAVRHRPQFPARGIAPAAVLARLSRGSVGPAWARAVARPLLLDLLLPNLSQTDGKIRCRHHIRAPWVSHGTGTAYPAKENPFGRGDEGTGKETLPME